MTMTSRHENPAPWGDIPEAKTFPVKVDGQGKIPLHVGNCAVALFRRRPEMDYLAIKNEDNEWTLVFDKHPLVYWIGGVALGTEAQRALHLVERNQGKFADRFGWNADVAIEDYPHPDGFEVQTYMDYLMSGSEDLHKDLNKALRAEFEE
jgi:hypothetical protein